MDLMITAKRKKRTLARRTDVDEALREANKRGELDEVRVVLEAMRDAQRARSAGIAELLENGGYHRLVD
jgi:hypothetical protein